jgi:hypothetical protein
MTQMYFAALQLKSLDALTRFSVSLFHPFLAFSCHQHFAALSSRPMNGKPEFVDTGGALVPPSLSACETRAPPMKKSFGLDAKCQRGSCYLSGKFRNSARESGLRRPGDTPRTADL